MIFDLVKDFADVLESMPREHPRHRILALLDEAIRRDVHFIDRHPTTLFQCLWNSCWWYDCPEAGAHYIEPENGWPMPGPPWTRDQPKLSSMLDDWRIEKEQRTPGYRWLPTLHPLPEPLGGRLRNTLRGHETWVYDIAFSAGGQRLASASGDLTVRVWDVNTDEELACLIGHTDPVRSVRFSSDGRSLISTGDAEVIVWDIASGSQIASTQREPLKNEFVYLKTLSSDGRLLARSPLAHDKGLVEIVDTASEECLRCAGRHTSRVNCLAFSANGRLLASGSGEIDVLGLPPDDCSIHIWDVATGAEIHLLRGHLANVQQLLFSPDGRYLISASRDNTARIWDAGSGAPIACLRHPGEVGCLAISDDNRWLATAAGDNNAIRIWALEHGMNLDLDLIEAHRGRVIAASHDGRRVATHHGQGLFCLRDSRSGEELGRYLGNPDGFGECALSPNGEVLALRGENRTIRLIDVDTDRELHRLRGAGSRCVFFAGGSRLLSMGGVIRIWEVSSGRLLSHLNGHNGFAMVGRDVAISPDGGRIASVRDRAVQFGDQEGRIWIWEADTGRVLRRIGRPFDGRSIAFSPDGKRLATFGGEDASVCAFDVTTGEECGRWPLPMGIVRGMAIAISDRSRIVCELSDTPLHGDANRTDTTMACVLDTETGEWVASTEGIAPLDTFAAGGQALMAVMRGHETAIVSADDGKTVATFLGSGVVLPIMDRAWTGGHYSSLDYTFRMQLEGAALEDDSRLARV